MDASGTDPTHRLWAPATSLLDGYAKSELSMSKPNSRSSPKPESSPIVFNEPPPTQLLRPEGPRITCNPAISPHPTQQQVRSPPQPNQPSKLPISLQSRCCDLRLAPSSHPGPCRSLLTSHLASTLGPCSLCSDLKMA